MATYYFNQNTNYAGTTGTNIMHLSMKREIRK